MEATTPELGPVRFWSPKSSSFSGSDSIVVEVVSFSDPPSNWIRVWRTSPEILGFLTWLVRSSHVIINIFTIVGGVWS